MTTSTRPCDCLLYTSDEQAERYLNSDTNQTFVSTPLHKGLVDMNRVLAELDRMGYKGLLLIEYQGEAPLTVLPEDVAYLRAFKHPLSQLA